MIYTVYTNVKFDQHYLELEISFQHEKAEKAGSTDFEFIPYTPETYNIVSVSIVTYKDTYPANWIIEELGEERLIKLIKSIDEY